MTALHSIPAPAVGYVAVRLTEREQRVLELYAVGAENEEIAPALGYSLGTVKKVAIELHAKFGSSNRAQLIHEAHRHGFLSFAVQRDDTGARLAAAEQTIVELEAEVQYLRAKQERARAALR